MISKRRKDMERLHDKINDIIDDLLSEHTLSEDLADEWRERAETAEAETARLEARVEELEARVAELEAELASRGVK